MRYGAILIAFSFIASCAASYVSVEYFLSPPAARVKVGPKAVDGIPLIDPKHPCGPTALALAAQLCGRELTLQQTTSAVRPDRLGRTSIAELLDACESLGLSAVGVQIDPARVSRLQTPVILHTNYEHFVVVVANQGGGILLLDPPHEPQDVAPAALRSLCTGRAVIVGSDSAAREAALAELGLSATAPRNK